MDQAVTGVTFAVAGVKLAESKLEETTLKAFLESSLKETNGTILKTETATDEPLIVPDLNNGFVGTALRAYNEHYHLVISPDDVWIAITTSLANYVDRNGERLRKIFVNHEGQIKLAVEDIGTIHTANYDHLINLISEEIDKNTKDDIRKWMECNFSTTTPIIRTVSKVVLMGAMKSYFTYKMTLKCGLPKVTLRGTVDDWLEIQKRIKLLATWNIAQLKAWSRVMNHALDHFVAAFRGEVDVKFWNGIVNVYGGGSGPTYLQGWILAFVPFDVNGKYVLNTLAKVKKNEGYGQMAITDIPRSAVEVPVIIDDRGTEYHTLFYAGVLTTKRVDSETLGSSIGWALIDITEAETDSAKQ